jgi:PPK2 family polyphosphate:nucleotide phosphotransferase
MDLTKRLKVAPGSQVKLARIDPSFHGKWKDSDDAKPELDRNLLRITALQRKLYADRRHSLLVVLQGIDGAGKDGTCWHVIGAMDPQGVHVQGFKQPTEEERDHDFLWRVHPHAPGRGRVTIFNRSHYEDVLIVRVHNLVPKSVWSERYAQINRFEEYLAANNVKILKFFLHISRKEQEKRFMERVDDPDKRWKISAADFNERKFWDDYTAAYEEALTRCNSKVAPWYVIPANKKWFRNLAVSHVIVETLEEMKLKFPAPAIDLKKLKQK